MAPSAKAAGRGSPSPANQNRTTASGTAQARGSSVPSEQSAPVRGDEYRGGGGAASKPPAAGAPLPLPARTLPARRAAASSAADPPSHMLLINNVRRAPTLLAEIQNYAARLVGHTQIIDPRLVSEAQRIVSELPNLGPNADTAERSLARMDGAAITQLRIRLSRIQEIRDEALAVFTADARNLGDPRIETLLDPPPDRFEPKPKPSNPDPRSTDDHIRTWLAANGQGTTLTEELLLTATRNYAAEWLLENPHASTRSSLTLLDRTLQNAIVYSSQGMTPSARHELNTATRQIISSFVRRSWLRNAAARSAELEEMESIRRAAQSDETVAIAPEIPTFEDLLGDETTARLGAFFETLSNGTSPITARLNQSSRDAVAQDFYELLGSYVHTVGLSRSSLQAAGPSAQTTMLILASRATPYSDEAIEAFRTFFAEAILVRPLEEMPPIEELRPASRAHSQAGPQYRFIPYNPLTDGGLRGLIANIRAKGIPTDASFREYVEARSGSASLDSIQSYGEFRLADEISDEEFKLLVNITVHDEVWPELVTTADQNGELEALLLHYPNGDKSAWATRVAFAKSQGRLPDLATEYTPEVFARRPVLREFLSSYIPSGFTQPVWQKQIESAANNSELARLALTNPPPRNFRVRHEHWEIIIANAVATGHPEDVSVEPRRAEFLDSMPLVFFALNSWVERHSNPERPFAIDPISFSGAAFVTFRRILQSGNTQILDDGSVVVTMPVPSFMNELAFRNWGMPTFARLYETHDYTAGALKPATQFAHETGETQNPPYNVMRFYLAQAETNFHTPEQKRNLELFATGFLRWLPVINLIFPNMLDESGSQVSLAPRDIQTRATIKLVTSSARYADGTKAIYGTPEDRSVTDVLIDVSSRRYSALLDLALSYLRGLETLNAIYPITLNYSPDEKTLSQLIEHTQALIRKNIDNISELTVRRENASARSPADLARIRKFCDEAQRFSRDVLLMHATGTATYPGGAAVQFFATVRTAGREAGVTGAGLAPLIVNDIQDVANAEVWPAERTTALFKLRPLIGRALFEGELRYGEPLDEATIVAAVTEKWAGDLSLLERAAADHVRLEEMPITTRTGNLLDPIKKVRTPGESEGPRGPALPRGAIPWYEQYRLALIDSGLPLDFLSDAEQALWSYFDEVPTGTFDLDVLRRAFADHHVPELFIEITVRFLQSIGVAEQASIVVDMTPPALTVEHVAAQAVMLYLASLAPDEPRWITDADALRARVSYVLSIETGGVPFDPDIVFARAMEMIEAHNRLYRDDSPKPLPIDDPSYLQGLSSRRIEAFRAQWSTTHTQPPRMNRVTAAYFDLAPQLLRRERVDRISVQNALARYSAGSVADDDLNFLEAFLSEQVATLDQWGHLVDNDGTGIRHFFREHYNNPYMNGDNLAGIASRYLERRILFAIPVDLKLISAQMASIRFHFITQAREETARGYRLILADWISNVDRHYADQIGRVHAALETRTQDAGYFPTSEDVLWNDILAAATIPSLDALAEVESAHGTVREMVGEKALSPTADLVHKAYTETIEPRAERAIADRFALTQRIAEEDEKVRALSRRVSEYSYAQFSQDVIDQMDGTVADATLAQMRAGLEVFAGFRSELAAIVTAVTGIEETLTDSANTFVEDSHTTATEAIQTEASNIKKSLDTDEKALRDQEKKAAERIAAIKKEEELKKDIAAGNALASSANVAAHNLTIARNNSEEISEKLGELQKSHDRLMAMANEGTPISYAGFTEVSSALSANSAATRRLIALSGELYSQLEGLVASSGPDKTPAQTLASLRALTAKLGDAAPPEWKLAEGELATALDPASDALEKVKKEIAKLEPWAKASDAAVVAMERRIVIGRLAIMPVPIAIEEHGDVGPDGETYSFSKDMPEKGSSAQAQTRLAPLREAVVLTVGETSHLVSRRDATLVNSWQQSSRARDLSINDIFGNPIRLAAGQMGIPPIVRWRDLPAADQTRRGIETLNFIAQRNGYMTELVAALTEQGMTASGTTHNLFLSLFSTLGATQGGETPSALAEAWALANRRVLMERFRDQTQKWFEASLPPRMTPGRALYGRQYSVTEHIQTATALRYKLAHPDEYWVVFAPNVPGALMLSLGFTKKQFLRDGVEIYDPSKDQSFALDLSRFGVENLKLAWSHDDSPASPRMLATRQAVYRDPRATPLGWLLLGETTTALLNPFSRTPLDRPITFSPKDVSDIALEIYFLRETGFLEFAELDAIPVEDIVRTEARPEQASALRRLINDSLLIRRLFAAEHLVRPLFEKPSQQPLPVLPVTPEMESVDISEANIRYEKQALTIAAIYRTQRQSVLATNPALLPLSRATPTFLDDLDPETASRFPEIALVGTAHIYMFWKNLLVDSSPINGYRVFGLLEIGLSPRFFYILTSDPMSPLLTLEDKEAFQTFAGKLATVAKEYQAALATGTAGPVDGAAIREIRAGLLAIYERRRPELLEVLRRPKPGMEITWAESYTGLSEPWNGDVRTNWEGVDPVVKLKEIARELMIVDIGKARAGMAVAEATRQSGESGTSDAGDTLQISFRSLNRFISENPDLESPAMFDLYMGTALMSESEKAFYAEKIVTFYNVDMTIDADGAREAHRRNFIDIHTDPKFRALARTCFQTECSSLSPNDLGIPNTDQTLGKYLTDEFAPWLRRVDISETVTPDLSAELDLLPASDLLLPDVDESLVAARMSQLDLPRESRRGADPKIVMNQLHFLISGLPGLNLSKDFREYTEKYHASPMQVAYFFVVMHQHQILSALDREYPFGQSSIAVQTPRGGTGGNGSGGSLMSGVLHQHLGAATDGVRMQSAPTVFAPERMPNPGSAMLMGGMQMLTSPTPMPLFIPPPAPASQPSVGF